MAYWNINMTKLIIIFLNSLELGLTLHQLKTLWFMLPAGKKAIVLSPFKKWNFHIHNM